MFRIDFFLVAILSYQPSLTIDKALSVQYKLNLRNMIILWRFKQQQGEEEMFECNIRRGISSALLSLSSCVKVSNILTISFSPPRQSFGKIKFSF